MKQLIINGIQVNLEKKKIKNMYLRILPPDGRINVSAPYRMNEDYIRSFILSKWEWIEVQQNKIQKRSMDCNTDYEQDSVIPVWGNQYKLTIKKENRNCGLEFDQDIVILYIKNESTAIQRSKIINTWYRKSMMQMIPPLIHKWEQIIGVRVSGFTIRDMKTRWGTCNTRTKNICLNLQLAKKHPKYLEYVIVHELVHLLEGSHNAIFKDYMDQFLPQWRDLRKELNGKVSLF